MLPGVCAGGIRSRFGSVVYEVKNLFPVGRGNTGVRGTDEVCKLAVVGRRAEDRSVRAESFEKLGGQHTTVFGRGEHKGNAGVAEKVRDMGVGNIAVQLKTDIVLRRKLTKTGVNIRCGVKDEADVVMTRERTEKRMRVLHTLAIPTAGVEYGFRPSAVGRWRRVEDCGIVAVIYNMCVRVDVRQQVFVEL